TEIQNRYKAIVDRLGEYMVAARTPDKPAPAGLDSALIQKLGGFLKDPKVNQQFLDRWRNASPDQFPALAKTYQDEASNAFAAWTGMLDKWRVEAKKKIGDPGMDPPEMPKFDRKDG